MSSGDMTPRQRFVAALRGEAVDRTPVANPTSIVTAELQDRIGVHFPEAHHDAGQMAALAMAGHDLLGFDVVFPVFGGGTHEAEALGVPVNWGEKGRMPACHQGIWKHPDEIVIPEDFLDHPAIRTPVEAVRLLKAELGERAAIIGKVYGPWSMAYHCFGLAPFLKLTLKDPRRVDAILDRLKEVAVIFGRAQVEAGADALCYGAHITASLIGPEAYPRFLRDIDRTMEAAIGAPLIFHCCGPTLDRAHHFNECGMSAFHFESQNDPVEMRKASTLVLVGNINNPVTLHSGSSEDVRREVFQALDAGVDIIAPECAVPLDAKSDNIRAIRDCVDAYHARH